MNAKSHTNSISERMHWHTTEVYRKFTYLHTPEGAGIQNPSIFREELCSGGYICTFTLHIEALISPAQCHTEGLDYLLFIIINDKSSRYFYDKARGQQSLCSELILINSESLETELVICNGWKLIKNT